MQKLAQKQLVTEESLIYCQLWHYAYRSESIYNEMLLTGQDSSDEISLL